MPAAQTVCALCGLPVGQGGFWLERNQRTCHFCCNGCRQVFTLLSEAAPTHDPSQFRNDPLVEHCRTLGLIPPPPGSGNPQAAPYSAAADPRPASEHAPQDVEHLTLTLNIQGMWCPACAWLIQETLRRTPGVARATCQFDLDRLRCHYDPVKITPRQITTAVARLGYQPAPPSAPANARYRRRAWIRLAVSGFLTMNVMMLSFALYSGFVSSLDARSIGYLSWPILIMGTAVVLYGGYPIYRRAWAGLSNAAFGMESLITLGTAGAWGLSLHHFIKGGLHLYFDTAAMLITLVLLGKQLEQNAKGRIRRGLEDFQNLRPAKVKLIPPGQTRGVYTAADQLHPGDLFEVTKGEVIPADGRLIQGRGYLDMSSLTGEAHPVARRTGDTVTSGSRVTSGTLRVRATQRPRDSVLGQMLEIMEHALARKTALEGRTDKIMQGFVPAVVLLALGTAAVIYSGGQSASAAWLRGVTVLVISCPCALGIAIPLARSTALGAALKQGFLVRNFTCFERIEQVDTVFFDKTGTLTRGRWTLSGIEVLEPFCRGGILAWAATLEAEAQHPAARQILKAAQREGAFSTDPPSAQGLTIHENGVCGRIDSRSIRLGSWDYIREDLNPPSRNAPWPDPRSQDTLRSRIYMTVDGSPAAVFVFHDELRPTAAAAVLALASRGLNLALVSGDDPAATREVAGRLGISDFKGGLSPRGKAAKVSESIKRGGTVAMVGDGINDAPAMASAQVALALCSTYDLGREVADVTLMTADPERLPDFWELAQRVNGKIYQNLVFTFAYNLLSIPVAMSGWLSPPVAVAAMLLSSLSVIGNTLGLLRAQPTAPPPRVQGEIGSKT